MSIIPVSTTDRKIPADLKLYSANNSEIKTYGELRLVLNLGLRRPITWNFCVADIPFAIICAVLLKHYRLSVNLHNRTLVDQITSLSIKGKVFETPTARVFLIDRSTTFARTFDEFPEVTGLVQGFPFISRTVNHHIVTSGSPVAERPRRLSLDKLNAAKAEFKRLVELAHCKPSSSPWASPIHMVRKKTGGESAATTVVLMPSRSQINIQYHIYRIFHLSCTTKIFFHR